MEKGLCRMRVYGYAIHKKKMQKVTDKNRRRTIDKKQSHKNYIAIKLNGT